MENISIDIISIVMKRQQSPVSTGRSAPPVLVLHGPLLPQAHHLHPQAGDGGLVYVQGMCHHGRLHVSLEHTDGLYSFEF